MELYRVLLVDDEENIREGISRKMDWQGLGFSLAGEASNGRDALELAEEILPDVVLTDIKMPFMDGLELCGSLTELLPVSKFVIFSGFDDFEYAKQAIRRNVSEYILKPINADELSAVLEYRSSLSLETLTELFESADFPLNQEGEWPQSFSYEKQGAICFSLPVPHALGDYVIVSYDPVTK